jgi:CHAT domain-containing protein
MNRPLNNTITLAGGINYDDIPASEENTNREESEEDFALNVNLINRDSKKIGQRDGSGIGLPKDYLQGTKEEVIQISNHLNGIWSVQTYSGSGASENILKMQLEKESPGVLHIATHGFAFPDAEGNDNPQPFNEERPSFNISEDPMVRCGLMLSGSNISWTGNPRKMIEATGDDGILTAAEVSNMDLSQTKLVVLSACETGLGKIEGSEGTFGLKRGFKLAGVEQMIVSLWSVPDKETMELMTLFYTDLTKTLNPVISFEKAQKEMRNKYPTEPEKWAGFVLVR